MKDIFFLVVDRGPEDMLGGQIKFDVPTGGLLVPLHVPSNFSKFVFIA